MKAEQINQLKKKKVLKKIKIGQIAYNLQIRNANGVNQIQIQNCISNKRKVITISEVPICLISVRIYIYIKGRLL